MGVEESMFFLRRLFGQHVEPEVPTYQAPYQDPYADYLEKCAQHPKDPTVFFTDDPDNLMAIHSHKAAAVFCVRDVSQALKDEIAGLESNPNLNALSEQYRFEAPPAEMNHIRDDMRYIAKLHSKITGEPLQKPLLKTSTAKPKPQLTTDADFHADGGDIGVRLHVTYAGRPIEGLSHAAAVRLREQGFSSSAFSKDQADSALAQVSEDEILNDIPLYAIGAFKGSGYISPDPDSPPHIAWSHRGPKRWLEKGIAAVFGLPYSSPELVAQRHKSGNPQTISEMQPYPDAFI